MPDIPKIETIGDKVVCFTRDSAYLEDGTVLVENGRPTRAIYTHIIEYSDRLAIISKFF